MTSHRMDQRTSGETQAPSSQALGGSGSYSWRPAAQHAQTLMRPSLDSLRWSLWTCLPPTTCLKVKPILFSKWPPWGLVARPQAVKTESQGKAAQHSSLSRVLVFQKMLCMAEIRFLSWMLKTWNCRWGGAQRGHGAVWGPSQGPGHSVGQHMPLDRQHFLPLGLCLHNPPQVWTQPEPSPPGALLHTQVSSPDGPDTEEAHQVLGEG